MPSTHDILLSHGEDNDITQFPYWGIVTKGGFGQIVLLAGIWFNRPDAEELLRMYAYRYSPKAFVYCFSGHMSGHLREMYKNALAERQEVAL